MAENQDAFEVVIAALTAQRDRIDLTISTLRQLMASGFTSAASALSMAETLSTPADEIKDPADKLGPGAFLGLTIVDAAKKQLAHERRQLTNAEMVDAFKKGGLVLNSADPLNTVGSVLNRRFMQVGDVVRVGRGTWGLKEWYPNRSFKVPTPATAPRDATASSPLREAMAKLRGSIGEAFEDGAGQSAPPSAADGAAPIASPLHVPKPRPVPYTGWVTGRAQEGASEPEAF